MFKNFFKSKDNCISMLVCFVLTLVAGIVFLNLPVDVPTVIFGSFFIGVFGLAGYAGVCQLKGSDNHGDPTASAIGIGIGLIIIGILTAFAF